MRSPLSRSDAGGGDPCCASDRAGGDRARFRALGDPTRLTIAFALREGGELCVCDLAWITERAQNLVSHHLRALRSAELVEYRREGKMASYSLTQRGHVLLDTLECEFSA